MIKPPKSEARTRLAGVELVSFVPMEDLGIDRKFVCGSRSRPLSAVAGSYTYFADGDVLLAKITPCFENGKLGIANGLTNGVGFGSSEYIVFRSTATLNKEWLYYFLSRESFREEGAARMAGAVGHKRVAKEFIENYPIPIPPLPVQKRIVAILDEAFEGIATAKASAEKNLRNARAVFESYRQSVFARQEGGWKETTIGDQVTFQRGFDITKNQQTLGRVPVVSSGGIKSFHDTAMAKAPGVVIGRKGTLGKVFYLTENYWPHDTTLWIKDFKGNHPRFVYHFMRNLDVTHLDTGTANPALNRNVLHPIRINWPRFDMQPLLTAVFDNLEIDTQRLAVIYERKLNELEALKKSLLHNAFAGELTAKKTKHLVEAAA
jgi:type I restriction enzyme, S subunit